VQQWAIIALEVAVEGSLNHNSNQHVLLPVVPLQPSLKLAQLAAEARTPLCKFYSFSSISKEKLSGLFFSLRKFNKLGSLQQRGNS
jgi:hypothetical protein